MNKTHSINSKSINQTGLQNGDSFPIQHFFMKDEGLFKNNYDKKTEEVTTMKVSEPLFIKETVQNLDTKDVYMTLCYKYKEKYHEIPIGMDQLAPNELLRLSGKGLDVSAQNMKLVSAFLYEQQKFAPHKEVYQDVGWHEEQGEMTFRHHRLLSKSGPLLATNDTQEGRYNLEPSGDIDTWIGFVYTEVLRHIPLQTMLCIGFSAPLVGYLSSFRDDVDTLLFHIVGDSTKGKTTGALLAASPFGMPSDKKKGLMKTWNGTKNAIPNMLGGNHGIPIVVDELSMSNAKSLTSDLYVLTNGQEKSRLNEDMKQRKQGTWATTIISTGEQSIFERTNQNVGLTVRAFEFSNITWTLSAESADEIRRVIQEDYGQAGEAFIQYLFSQGLSIIEEKWMYWKERLFERLPNSPFQARVAKKLAIVLAAGDLANDALNLLLDVEDILDFLVEEEQKRVASRDIGGEALNYMTQLVIRHQSNFRRQGFSMNPLDCWGKMFVYPAHVEVAFLKNILEEQLRLGGFDDPKVVIRDWKEKGILITEGDRATKRTKIFDDDEQKERKQVIGTLPKKNQDTTYHIKLDINEETLQDLMN